MFKYQKQTCIICKDQSYFLKKICDTCTNTFAHKTCIVNMIEENFNKCPTCRKDIMESSSIYITITNTNKINNKKSLIIKKISKNIFKTIEKIFSYLLIISIILFLFYYILGFIGFIIFLLINGPHRISLNPIEFYFLNQFFLGLVILFLILGCCCNHNYEDEDDY